MKIYSYYVKDEGNCIRDEHKFVMCKHEQEARETEKMYISVNGKCFAGTYYIKLSKNDINKIFNKNRDRYFLSYDIVYCVFLLEDDPQKAMELLKEEAEKDRENILKKLELKDDVISCICNGTNEE